MKLTKEQQSEIMMWRNVERNLKFLRGAVNFIKEFFDFDDSFIDGYYTVIFGSLDRTIEYGLEFPKDALKDLRELAARPTQEE